jgi:hypothetical protein
VRTIPSKEKNALLKKIQSDPTFKGTYMRSLLRTLYFNQINPKSSRFAICKEVFMTIPVVIYTVKDFYLLDKLNDKIETLKSAGLIEKWHHDIIKESLVKNDVESFPKVLELRNLMGSFQLFGLGIIVASLAFAVELLMGRQ